MESITVVMPAYREKKEQICQAIDSILNQTYKDFQYIIILDDPENMELKELLEEYEQKDARISLYVNEKNGGCPFSKDRGIRLADSEYVAIMDSDDISKPYRLEKQLKKIEDEKLDLVAGYVRVMDDNGTPLYNMDNLPLTHDKIAKKMRVNNCVPHPTWFFRREMYLALGGYTDMQGCEDYDFLLRAINAGYKLGIVDDILLDYRLSSQSVSRNNLYKQYLMLQFIQDKYFTHKYNYKNVEEVYARKYTEKKAEKYARASLHFEQAVKCKAQHKFVGMFVELLKACVTSGEYANKILRYVLQEM